MPWLGSKYAQKRTAQRRLARDRRAELEKANALLGTIEGAAREGLELVRRPAAEKLRAYGVHVVDKAGHYFAPASCAKLVKQWDEAQVFAGPAGHVKEFRELSLDRVCWLAAEEWKQLKKGEQDGT